MNTLRSLVIAISLGGATALVAQTPDAPRGHGPGRPGHRLGSPIVRALDADKDGVISAAEIANSATALKALDTDGDGKISASELRPARPADAPTPPADAPSADKPDRPIPDDPLMLALDANLDGELSAAEIANAPTSLKALDVNNDGQLTRDEFRPLPPKRE
jgi:Ca2+-binding EF-hand superfamily protein